MLDKIIYALGLILIFFSILFLTYITTKYIGGNAGKITKRKHLHVIETICLGRDKYLYLIKAGKDYILISSSNKGLQMLGNIGVDIEDETECQITEQELPIKSFKNVINKYLYGNLVGDNKQKMDKEHTNNAKEK